MQQGLRAHPQRVGQPLDFALPGGGHTRGFWTKRKKTITAMLCVLSLIAGLALAFKLFEQTVPNNVVRDASNFTFTIQAKDVTAGQATFHAVGSTSTVEDSIFLQNINGDNTLDDVNTFPGDSRESDVLITNTNSTPKRDASFETYIDPNSITVYQFTPPATYTPVVVNSPDWKRFVGFWTLNVQKQTYWSDPATLLKDATENPAYTDACTGGLKEINKAAPCSLGVIRAAGSRATLRADHTDDRLYKFVLSEVDDGTDQSQFKGWRITFSLVFSARLPAVPESDRYSLVPAG